jgi:UDP-N-acetylmuramyl pentapeptide synthase
VTFRQIRLRLHEQIGGRVLVHGRPVLCALALVWRRLLVGTTFVAITGSLGKTTAKECVAACLATRFRTIHPRSHYNSDAMLA